MKIMVALPDREQEKHLLIVLAEAVLEAGEEEKREASSRVLPCVDSVE